MFFSQLVKLLTPGPSVCTLDTYQLCSLFATKGSGVVALIPLSKGGAVNQDDAVLHQCLGSHQLIIGGIVDYINDPGLTGTACETKIEH